MALKDWKKVNQEGLEDLETGNSYAIIGWYHINKSNLLFVEKRVDKSNSYNLILEQGTSNEEKIEYNVSKMKALKYAKNYMKNH